MSDARIHATAVLGPQVLVEGGARIGANCVLDGLTRIGARATLGCGVKLCSDADIGPDCILEANVSTTAGGSLGFAAGTRPIVVGPEAYVGASVVLASGVKVGANAWIEAGSVVARDVPAHAIVRGNPGIVVGFRGRSSRAADMVEPCADPFSTGVAACSVAGVKIYRFPRIVDERGVLSFGEFGRSLPFEPKRYFFVYDVPTGELRGGHSRKTCEEVLFCVGGQVSVLVDDGHSREEIILDEPELGLHIPSRVWGWQYKYSPGAFLVVLASHYFDASDHISDYDEFVAQMKAV